MMVSRPAATQLGALALLAAALLLTSACGDEASGLSIANPDRMMFDAQVYPILVRDCGFHACHGTHERFYQVFGPGHGRIRPELGPFDATTPEELEHSYRRAVSMIDTSDLASSLLLVKPLSSGDGGVGHEGVDLLGRDVYQSRLELSYTILEQWVMTSQPPPTTVMLPPQAGTTGATP